jgi:hypothetical protein
MGEPELLTPLWLAICFLKETTDCMIEEGEPNCDDAKRLIKGSLYTFTMGANAFHQYAQEALKGLSRLNLDDRRVKYTLGLFKHLRNQPTQATVEEILRFFWGEGKPFRPFVRHCIRSWYFELATDLLLAFWKLPNDWLRRLRKCAYQECSEPYFLDRTAAGRSRFCPGSKGKHKTYHHRKLAKQSARPSASPVTPRRVKKKI